MVLVEGGRLLAGGIWPSCVAKKGWGWGGGVEKGLALFIYLFILTICVTCSLSDWEILNCVACKPRLFLEGALCSHLLCLCC